MGRIKKLTIRKFYNPLGIGKLPYINAEGNKREKLVAVYGMFEYRCAKCGIKVSDFDRPNFCYKCGNKFNWLDAETFDLFNEELITESVNEIAKTLNLDVCSEVYTTNIFYKFEEYMDKQIYALNKDGD